MTEEEGRALLAHLIAQEEMEGDDPPYLANPDDQLDPANLPADTVILELLRRGQMIDEFDN